MTMPTYRLLALAAAAALAGCATQQPRERFIPVPAAARAYMAAHPVPPVPGMTAGIITEQLGDVAWPCHHGRGSFGTPGSCGYYAGILLTTDGRTITYICGQLRPVMVSCTVPIDVPEPGEYVYVPDSLRVTRDHPVRMIREFAIDAEDRGVRR